MPLHLAVCAVGADRPGIVAALTGALAETGCNLEDTSMTILRGQFAMMLVVSVPEGHDAGGLHERLLPTARNLDLALTVWPVSEDHPGAPVAGSRYTLSLYGADRPGIVHAVAAAAAAAGANIVDLSTRVVGDDEHPVYTLLMDLVVPAGAAPGLETGLAGVADRLDVHCAFRPVDADIL